MAAIEEALDQTGQRLNDVYRISLPALSCQVEQAAVGLALQTLDLDVHRRKWALTIQGLKGEAKEDEKVTRSLCVNLAKQHLGVQDASGSDLAACHRLSGNAGSGVILRFRDLSQRNGWLSGAKGLKHHTDRISVSPDLPPVLRPLKNGATKQAQGSATRTKIQVLPPLPQAMALHWTGLWTKRPDQINRHERGHR